MFELLSLILRQFYKLENSYMNVAIYRNLNTNYNNCP